MENELIELAKELGRWLTVNGKIITTAESCTGGWIAQSITEIPGSSAWFDRGFVSYSNIAKMQMLGVNPLILQTYGAVSAEVAQEMVIGALSHSEADVAIAVTGIAGPDGGTSEKPVGTVFIAWASKDGNIRVKKKLFYGNRQQIRAQTVQFAIQGMSEL
ncbi:MAG: CinA family protein [Methylococcaceae bacterium]|nr:CinA family protein [Methylococcaceae bacterium]